MISNISVWDPSHLGHPVCLHLDSESIARGICRAVFREGVPRIVQRERVVPSRLFVAKNVKELLYKATRQMLYQIVASLVHVLVAGVVQRRA